MDVRFQGIKGEIFFRDPIFLLVLSFQPNICTYMGCIGKDSLGNRMIEEARKDKILSAYLIDEKEKTGYCAVLITDDGKKRSLVAYLGAANNMKVCKIIL